MKGDIIKDIGRVIVFLGTIVETDNILLMSQKEASLQILSATLANEVIKAYALMNDSEDDYKAAVAKYVAESTASAAKAEREAEALYTDKKKMWTDTKNVYKKLDTMLDRVDKISDSVRQRVSVVKQSNLKGIR